MDKNITKTAEEITTNTPPKAPESVLIMDLKNKLHQLAEYPELNPLVIEMAFGEVHRMVQSKAMETLKAEYEGYRNVVETSEKLKKHNEEIESSKGD